MRCDACEKEFKLKKLHESKSLIEIGRSNKVEFLPQFLGDYWPIFDFLGFDPIKRNVLGKSLLALLIL